jgi:hypothetical protein
MAITSTVIRDCNPAVQSGIQKIYGLRGTTHRVLQAYACVISYYSSMQRIDIFSRNRAIHVRVFNLCARCARGGGGARECTRLITLTQSALNSVRFAVIHSQIILLGGGTDLLLV